MANAGFAMRLCKSAQWTTTRISYFPCRSMTLSPSAVVIRRSSSSGYSTTDTSSLPKVARPSMWNSMIPKFLRKDGFKTATSTSKEWNPASYFILIFLLIGSQAIRLIALQTEVKNYTRKADAKIALLREVIERVQKGEDVDVERILGTGDEVKEREWEEVLREIEEEDSLWQAKTRKQPTAEAPDVAKTSSSNQFHGHVDKTPQANGRKQPASSRHADDFY